MGGRFTIGGTPGPLPDPDGSLVRPGRHSDDFSQHAWEERSWTMWDEPRRASRTRRKLLEPRRCASGAWMRADPTIQREFFGRWVRDTAILVFGALDDQLNAYDSLPEGDWSFAVGIDGGYVDEASIATLGWLAVDAAAKVYVRRSELFGHTGAHETIRRIAETIEPLGSRLVVSAADPAAGMKNIAEDVWTRHGIQLEVADKADKVGGCKLLASSVATRELLLPRGHRLFRSLRRVQWDPDHRGEKLKGHTPDDFDAVLYAYRKAYPWISSRPPAPEVSHDELLEQRIIAEQRLREDGDGF
jgi:hypothetical protein